MRHVEGKIAHVHESEQKIQDMDNKLQRGRELRDRHIAAIADKAKSENIKVVEIMNSASLEAEDKPRSQHPSTPRPGYVNNSRASGEERRTGLSLYAV